MPGKKLEPVVESEFADERDGVWTLRLAVPLNLSLSAPLQPVRIPAEIEIPKGFVGMVQVIPSVTEAYWLVGSLVMPAGKYVRVDLWVFCPRGMAVLYADQPFAQLVFVKG